MSNEEEKVYLEEKPIIEFPVLVVLFMVVVSLFLALGLLFLPWYMIFILFIGIALIIGIFLNPFVSIPLYLIAAFLRPLAFTPELVEYQLPVIAAFGILFAWFFHIMVYRDFRFPQTKQLFFCFIFLFFLVSSSLVYWEQSRFMFLDLLKLLILYFLVATLVKTKRHIFIIVSLLLSLGVLTAIYAIYQQMHGLGQQLGGGVIRPTGFEGNPNYLAMDLIILIPLVLALFLTLSSIFMKIILFFIFFLFLGIIGLTFSRAGVLGTLIVLFLCGWKFFARKRKIQYLLLIITAILIILPYLPIKYIERIKSIVDLSEVSIRGRLDGFIVGLLMMGDHPFIGVGIGRWGFEYWQKAITLPEIQTKSSWFPHNILIETGTQVGIIALIAFFLLIIYIFKDLISARKIVKEIKTEHTLFTIIQAMEISMFGFLVCSSFAATVHLKLFWMLAGFSVALKQVVLKLKE